MATFLQGATDFFPPDKLFTPNWGLVQQGLMLKQSRYDKGFAQLSSTARTVIDSPLLNEYSKERRSQILADAEQALKDLPNLDLSLPQNVAAASSLFRPFYEDNHILHDMVQTKQYMNQRQAGLALANASKDEDRNRYWNTGIEDLDNWADDFSKASPDDMLGMRSRRYVAKPNIDDDILKMFAEGKLKRSFDVLEGQYKYTYENGEPLKVPLINLYLSKAENDPEAMEGFNVMGRVARTRFIRENTQNGRFASAEEAATAHDNALANDYYNTQKTVLDGTEDAMRKIQMRLDGWKQRADAGTLIKGTKEYQDALDDQRQYDALKLKSDRIRGDIFDVGGKPAPYLNRITTNPTAHLANTYLNKMAIDLATSLSQFGTTKVDTNPVYKDLVLPFKLKDYDFEKQKQLEQYKTDESLRKTREEYNLKLEYGIPLFNASESGSATGSGTRSLNTPGSPAGGPGGINIPTVLDSEKSSAANTLPRDSNNQVNTFRLFNEINDDIRNQLVGAKLAFIEKVLDPSEIVDIKGNFIPANKRSELMNMKVPTAVETSFSLSGTIPTNQSGGLTLSGGRRQRGLLESKEDFEKARRDAFVRLSQDPRYKFNNEFDRLYDLAMTRYKSWAETGSDNAKYQEALGAVTRINNLNDVWTGAIEWKKERLNEVVENLAGSYPDKAFIYRALVDGANITDSAERFVELAKLSPDFAANAASLVPGKIESLQRELRSLQSFVGKYGDPMGDNTRRMETIREQINNPISLVEDELRNQFDTYKNEIELTWNKAGNEFNYFAENRKGGGVANRRLVFYGVSNIMGEDADRYTESLIQTVSTFSSEKGGGYSDDYVRFNFNQGNEVLNNSEAEKLFDKVKPALLNTAKIGGKENITQHQFESSQIAGNDGNWASYTIRLDPKWIQDNTSTKETTKLLTKTEAESLSQNGLTVYVKKYDRDDNGNIIRTIDTSAAATETGRIGEIDMLLRANDGYFVREIAPGFKISVSNLSTGGYKVVTDYVQNETLPNGVINRVPKTDSRVLDKSLDLTNAYYQILNSMVASIYRNEDIRRRVESSRMANPSLPKATWNDILTESKQ